MTNINHSYIPQIDIVVCLLSILLFFLLTFSYNNKNFRFKILQIANIAIFVAAISSITYNEIVFNYNLNEKINIPLMYISHHITEICLIFTWVMIILYLFSIIYNNILEKIKTQIILICVILTLLYSILEISSQITKFGFYIIDNVPYEDFLINPFTFTYIFYAIIHLCFFIKNRKIFPKKTFFYLSLLTIYCFLLMLICAILNTTSFNVLSFYIPILSVYIVFHGNKFDIESGTLGTESFNSFISELLNKNKNFVIINLSIIQNNMFKHEKSILNELSKECGSFFKNGTLFKKNDNILNIIIKNKYNKEIESKLEILEYVIKKYQYKSNIKITVLNYYNNLEIKKTQQIIDFNKFLIEKTPDGKLYIQTQNDFNNFLMESYIKKELIDIKIKGDLDDERVLVYCQPILNSKRTYKNAEVLMRLKLDKIDLVLPDDFIPIAEKYNLIHHLTLIVLNKTCKEIKKLLNEGYEIDRFSINFSANEFNDSLLYQEVIDIIDNVGIPYEKLAFEITETSFSKINNLNNIMERLIEKGIKFYLDDFGTGYSNIDRITELPFSTIKFDRSLVISSLKKDNTKFIVKNLCNIFNDLNFEILFEGIETDRDETLCKSMGAKYLQGYKYSKPIPIEKINEYLIQK